MPLQDIRDYREDELRHLRSALSAPELAVFIEGSSTSATTSSRSTSAGFRRGSSGFTLLAGVDVAVSTGRLFGERSRGGWGQQQPIDDSLKTISGPLLNGDLIWMPTSSTKLEFLARSEIDETTLEELRAAPSTISSSCRCNTPSGAISCSDLWLLRGRRLCRRSGDRPPHQIRGSPASIISTLCCRPMPAMSIPTSPALPIRQAILSRTR